MPSTIASCPEVRPNRTGRRFPPSILDPWLPGDAWVSRCGVGQALVLYLNNQPVTLIAALALDQATLNARLFTMRNRLPRTANRAKSIVTSV